jgi:NAD-dependent DNA ligase
MICKQKLMTCCPKVTSVRYKTPTTIQDKMNTAQISALAARLQAASHAYHNGLPILMSDDEFDTGVDTLRAAAPTHPFLTAVGAPVVTGDEVPLPVPLPSLNKIKPADGSLEKWTARFPAASYHASVKLDGCSALWLPAAGKLFTRGDGMLGRDISAFVPHFKGLAVPTGGPPLAIRGGLSGGAASSAAPALLPMAVRGELIMRMDSAAIPEGKIARNIVAGALNRKLDEVDAALFGEIQFVAYSLESRPDLTPTESYAQLRAAGFKTATAMRLDPKDMTPARLSELFTAFEKACPFQLDGVVVAPNIARPAGWKPEVRNGASVNPADRVAWKTRVTAQTARTTVRTVEWNVSASGYLIPRVLFNTVTLAGANIGAATGLHGRWIYDNGIGPGAEIEVRRAGDVIPQIIAVHAAAPDGPAMPAAYDWISGATGAESAVHICLPAGTETTESACIQLSHALGELGAENVGSGIVAKLYTAGFHTVGAIYAASQAELAARVEGVKTKGAERIWTGLRAKQPVWTELNFLCASCVMPRGVGHTKLKPLLALNPTPATWSPAAFKADRPAGLSAKTIDEICEAVPAYLAWRAANSNIGPAVCGLPGADAKGSHIGTSTAVGGAGVSEATTPVPTGPKMIVVLTGFRDKALTTQLEAAGHTMADTVSKKTTHVVYPDGPEPTSTKLSKAKELGATVLSASAIRSLLTLTL